MVVGFVVSVKNPTYFRFQSQKKSYLHRIRHDKADFDMSSGIIMSYQYLSFVVKIYQVPGIHYVVD